jgi:hypothetical protein
VLSSIVTLNSCHKLSIALCWFDYLSERSIFNENFSCKAWCMAEFAWTRHSAAMALAEHYAQ